jgi:hypothetical protein
VRDERWSRRQSPAWATRHRGGAAAPTGAPRWSSGCCSAPRGSTPAWCCTKPEGVRGRAPTAPRCSRTWSGRPRGRAAALVPRAHRCRCAHQWAVGHRRPIRRGETTGHGRWGGWGSNPRPRDHECSRAVRWAHLGERTSASSVNGRIPWSCEAPPTISRGDQPVAVPARRASIPSSSTWPSRSNAGRCGGCELRDVVTVGRLFAHRRSRRAPRRPRSVNARRHLGSACRYVRDRDLPERGVVPFGGPGSITLTDFTYTCFMRPAITVTGP